MESEIEKDEKRGMARKMASMGIPGQVTFAVAIITVFVALLGLLIGAKDSFDRFVKLTTAVMATEIVIVFAIQVAGLTNAAWLRRLHFLVTVLAGHIVFFTLIGAMMREGYGEVLLLGLGIIILVANAFGKPPFKKPEPV